MEDMLGVGKAIERLTEPVIDIIKRVAGPAADEIGLVLQDSIHVFRAKRALLLIEKFKKSCESNNIHPSRVRPNLLLPILDAASVEEDDDLHSAWANLLTNVATPESPPRPYRAFIEVLKQLSPDEARFFNGLFDEVERRITQWNSSPESRSYQEPHQFPLRIGVMYDLPRIYQDAPNRAALNENLNSAWPTPTLEFAVCLDNLKRLGLLPTSNDDPIPPFAILFANSCRSPQQAAQPRLGHRDLE